MSVRIIQGDCREVLAGLPAESVDCVVTSPPYWGLRDYGADGQLGMEPTLGGHLAVMVEVFRAVRRAMKPQATLWLNYGDCYTSGGRATRAPDAKNGARAMETRAPTPNGLKPKDLCMLANRLAIALQDDGWWVRSEIVWHKPNPMPESVTDRPATAHEKVWLLSKAARYFYDAAAVREAAVGKTAHDLTGSGYAAPGQSPQGGNRGKRQPFGGGWATGPGPHTAKDHNRPDKQRGHGRRHAGLNDRWDAMPRAEQQANGRNLRNVWTIATAPFSEAHFATFPPALVEPCIKAGCPAGGVVLDPFGGSGTVGMVADRLGRDAILIELNSDYAAMARRRIERDAGLFAEVAE